MTTIKAYTDIEQSKKLIGILSLESADMHYHYDYDFDELESIPTITEENDHFILFPNDVRCWSLAALLDVLPTGKVLLHDKGNNGYKCICNNIETYYFNNPIDSCYEMILKLNEINLKEL